MTVYADGPTRVLRFADQQSVATLEAQESVLDLKARLAQARAQLSMSFFLHLIGPALLARPILWEVMVCKSNVVEDALSHRFKLDSPRQETTSSALAKPMSCESHSAFFSKWHSKPGLVMHSDCKRYVQQTSIIGCMWPRLCTRLWRVLVQRPMIAGQAGCE